MKDIKHILKVWKCALFHKINFYFTKCLYLDENRSKLWKSVEIFALNFQVLKSCIQYTTKFLYLATASDSFEPLESEIKKTTWPFLHAQTTDHRNFTFSERNYDVFFGICWENQMYTYNICISDEFVSARCGPSAQTLKVPSWLASPLTRPLFVARLTFFFRPCPTLFDGFQFRRPCSTLASFPGHTKFIYTYIR